MQHSFRVTNNSDNSDKISRFFSKGSKSLSPVKRLLSDVFSRLKLHEETIRTFSSATPAEISDLWTALIATDSTLKEGIQYTRKKFADHVDALRFVNHCCRASHYSFGVLKRGSTSCHICKPMQLSVECFAKLHHRPHPMPGNDDHYKAFSDVFGKDTTENHRLSFKKKPGDINRNALSFYACVQHVKNAKLMVQCEECSIFQIQIDK